MPAPLVCLLVHNLKSASFFAGVFFLCPAATRGGGETLSVPWQQFPCACSNSEVCSVCPMAATLGGRWMRCGGNAGSAPVTPPELKTRGSAWCLLQCSGVYGWAGVFECPALPSLPQWPLWVGGRWGSREWPVGTSVQVCLRWKLIFHNGIRFRWGLLFRRDFTCLEYYWYFRKLEKNKPAMRFLQRGICFGCCNAVV